MPPRRSLAPALVLALLLPVAAQAGQAHYPVALQGTWYLDNAEGLQACATYKARGDSPDGALVGQLAISPARLNQYAEYGEGNEYHLLTLKPQGASAWVADSRLWLDGEDSGKSELLRLELAGGRLRLQERDDRKPAWAPAKVYRRCQARAR